LASLALAAKPVIAGSCGAREIGYW